MIKGWRNDPHWRRYYEQKEHSRLQNEFALRVLNSQLHGEEKTVKMPDWVMQELQGNDPPS